MDNEPIALPSFREHREKLLGLDLPKVFKYIYQNNVWCNEESASGSGSTLQQTKTLRDELKDFIKIYKITSITDAPCGDFNWMKEVITPNIEYCGVDIVPELVENNNRLYGSNNIRFVAKDITVDSVPYSQVLLCRDCLVHLSNFNILKTLRNFYRSDCRYLVATNFMNTRDNRDIVDGDWRPINLMEAPFYLPHPIYIIDEGCTENNGKYADKSLCVWLNNSCW